MFDSFLNAPNNVFPSLEASFFILLKVKQVTNVNDKLTNNKRVLKYVQIKQAINLVILAPLI